MKRVACAAVFLLLSASFVLAQDPPPAGQAAPPAAGRQGGRGGRGPALPPIDPPKEWLSAKRPKELSQKQACAAIGQSRLMQTWQAGFAPHRLTVAQVLLTHEDLRGRARFLGVKETLRQLIRYDTIPIINENDTVAVEELQTTFGDNDRLAAIVTNLIRAPLLVLLSDVDGLFDGDPHKPGSRVIPLVERLDASSTSAPSPGDSGRMCGGGVQTSCASRGAAPASRAPATRNATAIGRRQRGDMPAWRAKCRPPDARTQRAKSGLFLAGRERPFH